MHILRVRLRVYDVRICEKLLCNEPLTRFEIRPGGKYPNPEIIIPRVLSAAGLERPGVKRYGGGARDVFGKGRKASRAGIVSAALGAQPMLLSAPSSSVRMRATFSRNDMRRAACPKRNPRLSRCRERHVALTTAAPWAKNPPMGGQEG